MLFQTDLDWFQGGIASARGGQVRWGKWVFTRSSTLSQSQSGCSTGFSLTGFDTKYMVRVRMLWYMFDIFSHMGHTRVLYMFAHRTKCLRLGCEHTSNLFVTRLRRVSSSCAGTPRLRQNGTSKFDELGTQWFEPHNLLMGQGSDGLLVRPTCITSLRYTYCKLNSQTFIL